MRSRLALICVLSVGVLFSGAGATLALTGDLSAAQSTYQPTNPTPQVLGQNQTGQTPSTQETLPSTQTTPSVQTTKQVAASANETLPFTGFAAITILGIGLLMIIAGAVLTRRSRDSEGRA